MKNTIKIHLNKREDYKNKYNENILSYELCNYILEEVKSININQSIMFLIESDFNMSDIEKDNFVDMLRNNFGADIGEIMNISKKQNISNTFILIIGLIFFGVYTLLNNNFISEFLLILGWVFLGEAICNFLYGGIENKYRINRRKQIVDAKVIFENIKK